MRNVWRISGPTKDYVKEIQSMELNWIFWEAKNIEDCVMPDAANWFTWESKCRAQKNGKIRYRNPATYQVNSLLTNKTMY